MQLCMLANDWINVYSQGTNAHVILEASTPTAPNKRDHTWRRRRFWAAPMSCAALCGVAAARRSNVVVLETRLHGAANACLLDHR